MTALDPNKPLPDEEFVEGACKDHESMPPDAWYALEDSYDGDPRHVMSRDAAKALAREAQRVCRRECMIRQSCLGGALERQEDFGIFGGLTARQRRKIGRDIQKRTGA